MNDRELLELAARAAGLLPLPAGKELDYSLDGGLGFCGGGEYVVWNPLTDDGDALRLAVKLSILVHSRLRTADAHPLGFHEQISEPHNGDPYAATRRAIVRAAAEIGKSLQEQPQ